MTSRFSAGLAIALLAALLPVFAPAAPMDSGPLGRIYHYLRTNIDGSEPEHVYVFRAGSTKIEVYKMVEKCTNAALVTADLDLELGYALRITGGRLKPNAEHLEFAFVSYDKAKRTISMRIDLSRIASSDAPKVIVEQAAANAPFHIYDFDLSDLTVMAPGLTKARKDVAFDFLVLWPPATDKKLRFLGKAELKFKGEEKHPDRSTLRYEAIGPAFGHKGGPIWFDAKEGHIVDVEWKIPNHAEYKDFKLALQGVDDGGASSWKRLLTAHFEHCPKE